MCHIVLFTLFMEQWPAELKCLAIVTFYKYDHALVKQCRGHYYRACLMVPVSASRITKFVVTWAVNLCYIMVYSECCLQTSCMLVRITYISHHNNTDSKWTIAILTKCWSHMGSAVCIALIMSFVLSSMWPSVKMESQVIVGKVRWLQQKAHVVKLPLWSLTLTII